MLRLVYNSSPSIGLRGHPRLSSVLYGLRAVVCTLPLTTHATSNVQLIDSELRFYTGHENGSFSIDVLHSQSLG